MKLLIVLVSTLVLVAHGKVLIAEEVERAYDAQYQGPSPGQVVYAADVDSSEEEQAAAAQNVYAVNAVDSSVPIGVRLFGAEAQGAASSQGEELGAAVERPASINIPIVTRACTDSVCAYICSVLGFTNGVCTSTTTCQCSN